jgi:hypothetical protein
MTKRHTLQNGPRAIPHRFPGCHRQHVASFAALLAQHNYFERLRPFAQGCRVGRLVGQLIWGIPDMLPTSSEGQAV